MRHNLKQEFQQSMDGLSFSDRAKEDMTQMLIKELNHQNRRRRTSGRKLLTLSLAAVLLIVLAGAATYTRWSRNAQHQYHPSQEIKEQAEKSRLSVILESQETKPNEVLSAADQGITITAVQSIIDDYRGEITFRIEGFDLPEGKYPHVWPAITIGGDEHFFSSLSGHFFDGTTRNEADEWVYADTGLPVELGSDGSVILKPVAQDGSFEYTSTFILQDGFGSVDGKEIMVSFDGIGVQSDQKAGIPTYLVEGSWELRWILSSTSDAISLTPNASIGDSGVTLLTADIGQKTITATYQLLEYWDGWETLESLPEAIQGVRMKDGTEYLCHPSAEGYQDMEKLVYHMELSMFDTILDPGQVESLMFHKGWETDSNGQPTAQIFEYLPVS